MSPANISISATPHEDCANYLVNAIEQAIAKGRRATWAICGGRTPAPTYRAMARAELNWKQVDVYFGDERCVPPESPQSTFALLQEHLIDFISGAKPRVHRVRAEGMNDAQTAQDYAAQLPDRLDVVFLGMGPDGHTASLFPGASAAMESSELVVPVIGPKAPPRRITLTPRAIRAARERVLLVTVPDKAEMVARVLEGPVQTTALPAQIARDGTWFLDPAAGAALRTNNS